MASLVLLAFGTIFSAFSLRTWLVVFLTCLSAFILKKSPKRLRNPVPGPFTIPIFGSIFALPSLLSLTRRHQFRVDLAKKYGRVYQIEIGPIKLVFLNDTSVIKEAFITKGEVLSDRPQAKSKDELSVFLGMGKGIANANYGKALKERKNLTLHSMKDFGFGGKSLEETALEETEFLIGRLKEVADGSTPTDLHQKLIHLAVSNVICSVVFGRRFDYDDESFVSAVNGIKSLFNLTTSGTLKKLPFVSRIPYLKRKLEEQTQMEMSYANDVISFVEEQIRIHREEFDPNYPRDFVDLCLQKDVEGEGENKSAIHIENVKKIIVDLFFAGTDTTSSALSWFILYMIRYPDIQQACQGEIDEAFESQQDLSSMVNLSKSFPYTTATLMETLRIAPVTPTTLPHVAREDTTLGGFDVAKGSFVFANIRFLHFDEKYWVNPEMFNPERWLDPNDSKMLIQHSNFLAFSMGKRRCLGENLAKVEYSAFAISLLRNFTLKNDDLTEISKCGGSGLIYSPEPFELLIESRHTRTTHM